MSGRPNEDVRFRILRHIEANPEISQRNLARAVGISLGSVNYCLNALKRKGHVKIRRFRASDSKRAYAYLLTPCGAREKARLARGFLRRKRAEYVALRAEIAAIEADLARTLAEDDLGLGRHD